MRGLVCLNRDLTPWNFYNDHRDYDPSMASSLVIDEREWYNSYMPPFFLLEDFGLVVKIKKQIDSGLSWNGVLTEESGKIYKTYLNGKLKKEEIFLTLEKSRRQLKRYFLLEKRIQSCIKEIKTFVGLLGFLHFSLNMMQLFHDPVEAFTTGKTSVYFRYPKIYDNQNYQLRLNSKLILFEVLFIPLSILVVNGSINVSREKLKYLSSMMLDVMGCTESDLDVAYKHALKKYDFGRYMSTRFAEEIVSKSIRKVSKLKTLSFEEKIANEIQMINSMMTWSKFIPISKEPLCFRYHTTGAVIELVRSFREVRNDKNLFNNLKTITVSGAERQARLFYLVRRYMEENPELKSVVLERSSAYCDKFNL